MPPFYPRHDAPATTRFPTLSSGVSKVPRTQNQREIDALPSMDSRAYYDPMNSPALSSSSDDNSPPPSPLNITSNSGNKLHPSARFMRKGKMCAWGPSYEEHKLDARVRRRMKLCLEQLLPEAAAELGVEPPKNIVEAEAKRAERKRKREEDKEYHLPHLASPSPPTSTSRLAPLLSLPQSYVDIMTSPSLRHSLGDDSMEVGLQRTAGELLESEKGLMQALGRLKEVLRVRGRDVPADASVEPATNGHHSEPVEDTQSPLGSGMATPMPSSARIPPLPHISDTDNLWRVTQELLQAQPQPTIAFTVTPAGAAAPSANSAPHPTPTPIHRLFTCPTGITVNSNPHPNHPNYGYPPTNPLYPQPTKYNLDLTNQCRAVDDAMERIAELLADCNEYKERLEEARDRVSDVARARKRVWGVVKERASRELDRESKA